MIYFLALLGRVSGSGGTATTYGGTTTYGGSVPYGASTTYAGSASMPYGGTTSYGGSASVPYGGSGSGSTTHGGFAGTVTYGGGGVTYGGGGGLVGGGGGGGSYKDITTFAGTAWPADPAICYGGNCGNHYGYGNTLGSLGGLGYGTYGSALGAFSSIGYGGYGSYGSFGSTLGAVGYGYDTFGSTLGYAGYGGYGSTLGSIGYSTAGYGGAFGAVAETATPWGVGWAEEVVTPYGVAYAEGIAPYGSSRGYSAPATSFASPSFPTINSGFSTGFSSVSTYPSYPSATPKLVPGSGFAGFYAGSPSLYPSRPGLTGLYNGFRSGEDDGEEKPVFVRGT